MPTITGYATSVAQTAGTWANPTNAVGSTTANFATWTDATRRGTATLRGIFDSSVFASIPANATINSITVAVKGYVSNATNVPTIQIKSLNNGTQTNIFNASPSTTSTNVWNVGSDSSITLANLQAGTVQLEAVFTRANNTTSAISYVDYFSITVDYSSAVVASDTAAISVTETASVVKTNAGALIFEDNFTSLDTTKWNVRTYPSGYVNNELQNYDPSAVTVDANGNLVITATKNGTTYTSGRLDTLGKFSTQYGKVEARIQLPAGQGLWPAFWAMADESTYGQWPRNGEIDIMEAVNNMDRIIATLHGPQAANPANQWQLQQFYSPGGTITGFHTYAMAWEPGAVHFYFDGMRYRTMYQSEMPAGSTWVFDRPFYLLLNLAVGGDMPGAPDATTQFPAQMLVDYVRVWSQDTYPVVTPKVSTLVDDFSDQREFDNWNANAAISDGKLNLVTAPSYPGVLSQRRFDLTNSSIMVELVQTPNAGTGTTQAVLQLVDGNNSANKLEFGWTNNTLYAGENNNGTTDSVYPGYNPATDKYLRIRHDGTNVIWETSADTVTWNSPIKTKAVTATDLTRMQVALLSGYYGTETAPGVAIWDNINTAPASANTVSVSANDTGAVSVADSSSAFVSISASDGAAVSVAESTSTFVTLSASDSGAIGVAETTVGNFAISASDSIAVSITEAASATSAATIPGTETNALAVTEQSTTFVTLSASDGAAVSATENRGIAASTATSDSAAISVSESSSLLATGSVTDTAAMAVTETSTTLVGQPTSETAGIAIAETASTFVTLSANDTSSIGVTEGTATFKSIIASDSATLSVYEVSNADITTPGTETYVFGITETVTIGVDQPASDGAAVAVSEAAEVLVKVQTDDSIGLQVDDTTAMFKQITAYDTVAVSVNDTTSSGQGLNVSGGDTGSLSINETIHRLVTLSASDSGAIAVEDTTAQNVTLSASDSASIATDDSSATTVSTTASDTAAISVTEASTFSGGGISTGDTNSIAVSETSSLFVTVRASDTASIAISSASSLGGNSTKTSVDSASLSVSESAVVKSTGQTGDNGAVSVTEASSVLVRIISSDTAAVSVSEAVAGYSEVTANDRLSIVVGEVAGSRTDISASDSGSISLLETATLQSSEGFKALSAEDHGSIAANEHRRLNTGKKFNPLDAQIDSETKVVSFASGSQGGTIEEVDTSTNTNVRMEGSVTPERRVL